MVGKVENADGDQTRTGGKRLTALGVKALQLGYSTNLAKNSLQTRCSLLTILAISLSSVSGAAQERQLNTAKVNFSSCLFDKANFAKENILSPERFDMLIKGSCFKEQREFETESLKFLAPPQPFFPEGQQAERTRQVEAKDMTKAAIQQFREGVVTSYLTWYLNHKTNPAPK